MQADADVKLKEAHKISDEVRFTIQKEEIKQRDFVINKFEGFLSNLVKNPRAIEMISEHKSYHNSTEYLNGGSRTYATGESINGTIEKTEIKD